MHKNVEVLIGRLATDTGLQRRFAKHPIQVLLEQRLELSEIELAALATIDPVALRAFTAVLDARLRKVSSPATMRPANDETPAESTHDSEKEIQE